MPAKVLYRRWLIEPRTPRDPRKQVRVEVQGDLVLLVSEWQKYSDDESGTTRILIAARDYIAYRNDIITRAARMTDDEEIGMRGLEVGL